MVKTISRNLFLEIALIGTSGHGPDEAQDKEYTCQEYI
jgi:hypothetical protein